MNATMPGPTLGLPPAGFAHRLVLRSETLQQVLDIPEGDEGTAVTIDAMLRAIRGEEPFPPVSPRFRELAEDLIAKYGLLGRRSTETERVLPLYDWVRARMVIPQVKDRAGVEEIRSPDYLLDRIVRLQRIPYDCDDSAILLCTLVGSIGLPPRLVAISTYRSAHPEEYSHIYTEVSADDRWMPLDPILGREAGWATADQYRRLVVPVWT